MSKNCEKCNLNMINGNSIDIKVNDCDSEIKADIVVAEFSTVRVWGQIKNCYGEPIANALLKLVRVVRVCNECQYQGIAHTVSDCNGFYQFDICVDLPDADFKIIVNKAATGTERIIDIGEGNCNACTEPEYQPCGEYKSRVTPPDHIVCDVKKPCYPSKCQSNKTYQSSYDCTPDPCYAYCVPPKSCRK